MSTYHPTPHSATRPHWYLHTRLAIQQAPLTRVLHQLVRVTVLLGAMVVRVRGRVVVVLMRVVAVTAGEYGRRSKRGGLNKPGRHC